MSLKEKTHQMVRKLQSNEPVMPSSEFFRQLIHIRIAEVFGSGESNHSQHICNPLNPFPNKPWFLRVCSTSLLKTLWEKEKLLITSNFSFSHSVFYPFGELPSIFIKFKIVVCKLFQFGPLQNIVVWERVKIVLFVQSSRSSRQIL